MMQCILCLDKTTEVLQLFDDEGSALDILNVIRKYFLFVPKEIEEASKCICCSCWSKVNVFHGFYCEIEYKHKALSETHRILQLIKKEVGEEWIVDTKTAEYAEIELVANKQDVVAEDYNMIDYKVANESKKSDSDDNDNCDESRSYSNDGFIGDSVQSDKSDNEAEIKIDTDIKPETKIQSHKKRKRGRPKKKPPNASDSEDDLPLNYILKQKKDKELKLELLKQSKETDEKIAQHMELICEICNRKLETFAQVKQHYRSAHKRKGYVVCCNKKLYKRILLLDHVNKHINPECFKCDTCNKTFASRNCLKSHNLYKHISEEAKVFQCDQCPQRYAKQYQLDQHKLNHAPPGGELQFRCNDCGKEFATKRVLNAHCRYIHQNAYNNMCDICAKVIRGKLMFKKHRLEHAGIVEPKVQCKKCGAWLKHKYSLKKHMKLHQEATLIHKCDICGKVAPSRGALRSHFRYVHEAERSYRCGICDKAFKKSITLREHMTTHTGEVLYTCTFCPKTFNSSANMFAHRKRAHKSEWEETRKTHLPEPDENQATTK